MRSKRVLVGALVAALAALPAVAAASVPQPDPAGDTANADKQPVDSPRGDVVSFRLETTETDFVFSYTVSQPVDPLTDPGWPSEDTYTDFWIDTDGGAEPDFDAEYGFDEGELYVIVVSTNNEETLLCEGKGTYDGSRYVAAVPKACLGSPQLVNYRVDVSYDADPDDHGSPVAYDTAPDSGMVTGYPEGAQG